MVNKRMGKENANEAAAGTTDAAVDNDKGGTEAKDHHNPETSIQDKIQVNN